VIIVYLFFAIKTKKTEVAMRYLFLLPLLLSVSCVHAMETPERHQLTKACAVKLVDTVFEIATNKYGFSNPHDRIIHLKQKHAFALEESPTEAGMILQCKNNVPTKIHVPSGTLEFAEVCAVKNAADALLMQDILKVVRASTVDVESEDPTLTYYRIEEVENQKLPFARFKNPSKN
jgi:hypothetical protein